MDILGNALQDYFLNGTNDTLWVLNSYGADEEMPVEIFFREENEMPEIELEALDLCRGHVLDIGAGAGSHALALQQRNLKVTALDISPKAVSIMKQRGVKDAREMDVSDLQLPQTYDTLLFMMNGIGITGSLPGLSAFLEKAKSYLSPGGQLVFDSSDISYLYQEIAAPLNVYYGEVAFAYQYKSKIGKWFNWIYVDPKTLQDVAEKGGWHCQIIMTDENEQYLAQLTLK